MGHFLSVAYMVLKEKNHPMSVEDITDFGINNKWLKTKGKTPSQTMKSKLSTDILKYGEVSLFMRTDTGFFALREWKDEYKEYIADRFQKALFDEKISVFPISSLQKYIPGPGLHEFRFNSKESFLHECFPMMRREAEKDFSVIQLISVFIIRYKRLYLTYKRTRRLPERRLHNFYSIFFGGHLSQSDIELTPMFNIFDSRHIEAILIRELREEVHFLGEIDFRYKGILYDDSRKVSTQHLGIVYDVFRKSDIFKIKERGFLMQPKFESLVDIIKRINEFENWSELIIRNEMKTCDYKLK